MSKAALLYTQRMGMATRIPSIKFTHGLRSQIDNEMSQSRSKIAPHFAAVGHAFVPSQSTSLPIATGPTPGKTLTFGGVITQTTHYGEFIGDPFQRKPSIVWDDDIINLVTSGGVPPEPKKDPKKDAKKGGKK